MKSSYQTILSLFDKCLNSKLDLMSFCEEFTFLITHHEDEALKDSCAALISIATDYMLNQSSKKITPETIHNASVLFDTIRKTHDQLTKN